MPFSCMCCTRVCFIRKISILQPGNLQEIKASLTPSSSRLWAIFSASFHTNKLTCQQTCRGKNFTSTLGRGFPFLYGLFFFDWELCQGNYLEFPPALPKRIKNESMMSHISIFPSRKQYHHTSRMPHPPSKHHALLRVNHYKLKSICICLRPPIWVPLNDPLVNPLPFSTPSHRWHNPRPSS